MKSNEVNSSLIGRRVKGICFGGMVTGTVTGIAVDEYSATVYFRLDTPVNWGGDEYRNGSNWARKADEFGSLHHMELI